MLSSDVLLSLPKQTLERRAGMSVKFAPRSSPMPSSPTTALQISTDGRTSLKVVNVIPHFKYSKRMESASGIDKAGRRRSSQAALLGNWL
jgi:hypothetical protein